MRIIGGTLKGRSIKFLRNSNTRPLKDNVKENIFNILNHSIFIKTKIANSKILDLYSGIGSFGIECLSRGAEKVYFIEKDIVAMSVLEENLINLSIISKSKTYVNSIEDVLTEGINEKFDIFFFDPPFADLNFLDNLKILKKKKIYNKNHLVIIHRDKKSKDGLENLLEIINIKQYGRSKIIFGVFNWVIV